MAATLLVIHSYLRWIVLLAGALAIATMLAGTSRAAPYSSRERGVAMLYIGVLDLQFLLGIVLYLVSPVIIGARHDMAAAMQDAHVRFFVAEHPVMMLIAVVVAHVTNVWARKAPADRVRFQRSAIGFAFSVGLVVAGVPWFRMGNG